VRKIFACALLGLLASVACSSGANFRFVAISGAMPPLSGRTVSGQPLHPGLYAGKSVLINFWASWCPPCRREQTGMEALWKRLAPRGAVQFVGVDHLDRSSAAERWIDQYGVTYPSLADPDGRIAERFDVPYLPATILVDRFGRLRYRLIGAQPPAFVQGLLAAVAAISSSQN